MNSFSGYSGMDDPVVNGKFRPIALSLALRKYPGLQKKTAYFIRHEPIEGPPQYGDEVIITSLFGITDDHATIFSIDEEVYRMIGRPQAGKRVPVCPIAVVDSYLRSR